MVQIRKGTESGLAETASKNYLLDQAGRRIDPPPPQPLCLLVIEFENHHSGTKLGKVPCRIYSFENQSNVLLHLMAIHHTIPPSTIQHLFLECLKEPRHEALQTKLQLIEKLLDNRNESTGTFKGIQIERSVLL